MRSITLTLNERDARIAQEQIEQWLAQQQGSSTNKEGQRVFSRLVEQLRYLAADESQTSTARG